MHAFKDIKYGPLLPHSLDLYVPRNSNGRNLIVYVHGGAWRSEDKSDHSELAIRIANSTASPVAVLNYRLTPQHPEGDDPSSSYTRHPSHAQDVLVALTFLYDNTHGNSSGRSFNKSIPGTTTVLPTPQSNAPTASFPISLAVRRFHLIGHSCGAHILTSIFLSSASVTPILTPLDDLIAAVRSVTLSEGIYDLDALIQTFPSYDEWFVKNAFGERKGAGDDKPYAPFATTTYPLRPNGTHIRWNVLHSRADSLVDIKQSELIAQHLRQLHDQIKLGRSHSYVLLDTDSLKQEHDEMLKTKEYSDVVSKYIKAVFK